MSTDLLLLKSLLIGIAIAAPVGPIGLLCIRNTLTIGAIAGLGVGLGAAIADGVYGLIASCGMTFIAKLLINHAAYIKIFGGLFLLYLGYKEFKTEVVQDTAPIHRKTLLPIIFTTFLLTLTNPMTIMSFMGVFSSVGGIDVNISESMWMVLGIFIGSLMWWCILVLMVSYSKKYLSLSFMRKIKYISGGILCGFGGYSLLSFL